MDDIDETGNMESDSKTTPQKPGVRGKIRKSEVAKLLAEFGGNVSAVARKIGVARSTVYKYVTEQPALQRVMHDARETALDHAESSLLRAILNGEPWAVCFMLKTQGRQRGYVERQEILQNTRVTMAVEEMSDEQLARIALGGSSGGGGGIIETTASPKEPHRLLPVHNAGVQAGAPPLHPEQLHRPDGER